MYFGRAPPVTTPHLYAEEKKRAAVTQEKPRPERWNELCAQRWGHAPLCQFRPVLIIWYKSHNQNENPTTPAKKSLNIWPTHCNQLVSVGLWRTRYAVKLFGSSLSVSACGGFWQAPPSLFASLRIWVSLSKTQHLFKYNVSVGQWITPRDAERHSC